jgi:hypothetical protein
MAIEPHLNNKINNPIKNPINKTHINSNPKSKSPNQKNSIIKTHINSLIHYPSTIIDLISLSRFSSTINWQIPAMAFGVFRRWLN